MMWKILILFYLSGSLGKHNQCSFRNKYIWPCFMSPVYSRYAVQGWIWCTRYERALWDGLSCWLRDLYLLSSMFSIQAFFSAALVQMKIFESTIGPGVHHKYRCTMFKYFCDFKMLIFRVNLDFFFFFKRGSHRWSQTCVENWGPAVRSDTPQWQREEECPVTKHRWHFKVKLTSLHISL